MKLAGTGFFVIKLVCRNQGASGDRLMPTEKVDYRRIANEITEKIKSGNLAPGEKLPSTRELAEEYGVHISTINRVMTILKDRELVEGHPGKGVYVAEAE
ncbi:winged helix-turn-helix domain-containing protein [Micromonospora sp. CPCC 205539]|uniref:winged helix-turn-helix domain-containing protein n=1 Tax=Micromonospora sp. CPCC 205539 TaxID=3122408 RepID=UPI002FF06397